LILILYGLSVWVGASFIEQILLDDTIGQTKSTAGTLATFFNRTVADILKRSTPFRSLLMAIGVLMSCALLMAALRIFKHIVFALVNQSILLRIRKEMFDRLTHLDLSFSNKNRPGEISSLFIRDTEQLNYSLVDAADRLFMQPLRLIFAFTLMLSLSWRLTCWTIPFLIVSGIIVHYTGAKIERLAKSMVERIANLQGNLTEYISTVVIARAFNRESYERERFSNACKELKKTNITLMLAGAITPQIVRLVLLCAGGVLLLVGSNEIFIRKSMSGSTLVKMTLLLPMAAYPMQSLSSLYVSIRTSIASAKRVFQFIDESDTDIDVTNAIIAKPFEKAIVFDCVSYVINGTRILSDLNCTIPKGCKIIVFGPSGVGKTTLLRLIARFVRCTSGTISVDGIDLKQLQGSSWRQLLGIVPQEPTLINGTLRDNLLYVCPEANDELLKQVLQKTLLWDDTCVFKNGLDTIVGNRGNMISGGERQRVTIARALLNSPDILLLDEPTSMLDQESQSKIVETIEHVAQGRTVVISTHDTQLRKIADIELLLENGSLANK
jgi:ABC-type multidrug transport system fused ATPase/permease subunit